MGKLKYARPEVGEYVKAGVGYSIASNSEDAKESFSAGKEAAQMAVEFMKERYGLDEKPDLALTIVFASTRYRCGEMLKGVRAITGDCPLIGCTTAGEITTQGVHDNSVSVFVLSSDVIAVGTGVGNGVAVNPIEAGETAALEALQGLQNVISTRASIALRIKQIKDPVRMIRFFPYSILMFPPGQAMEKGHIFNTRDDYLIDGLREEVGYFAPLVGGSSGDGRRAGTSYQFCNGKFYDHSVACGILTSFVKIGFATELPFVPTKKSAVVTKLNTVYPPSQKARVSRGFVIEALDGIPAAEKYFEFLPEEVRGTDYDEWIEMVGNKLLPPIARPEIEYPLGLTDISGKMWPRVVSGIRRDGSIEFPSPIPENVSLTLMEPGLRDKRILLYETTRSAVENAIQNANISRDEVAAVIVFPCSIHRWIGEEYLFDISQKFKTDLENNTISEDLRSFLSPKGIALSTNAKISKVEDNEWKILDGKVEYVIIGADGQLKLFQGIGECDLDAIKDIVGEDVPIIGFYSYGEQLADLHTHIPGRLEQSCTVMLISQALVSEIFRINPKEKGDAKVILSDEREDTIRRVVSEVENEPQELIERDLLTELKDYAYVAPEEIEDIGNDFNSFLSGFIQEKFERPVDEKTKQFIKNELIYLILKLEKEKEG